MNKNFLLKLPFVVFLLAGCQSTQNQRQPIPEKVLTNLSAQWVAAEACYKSGYYNVNQAANYREAINYSFSTWSVEQSRIDNSVTEIRSSLLEYQSKNGGLDRICKSWQLQLEAGLREANNHKNQMLINQQRKHEINKANSSQSINYSAPASNSNVVQCYKTGDISFNKNIQTFNGMVCPVGWLQYYGY